MELINRVQLFRIEKALHEETFNLRPKEWEETSPVKSWERAGRLREQEAQRLWGDFYMLRSLKKASVYGKGGGAGKSIGEVNGARVRWG